MRLNVLIAFVLITSASLLLYVHRHRSTDVLPPSPSIFQTTASVPLSSSVFPPSSSSSSSSSFSTIPISFEPKFLCSIVKCIHRQELFSGLTLGNGATQVYNPSPAVPWGNESQPLRLGGELAMAYRALLYPLTTPHVRLFSLPRASKDASIGLEFDGIPTNMDVPIAWVSDRDVGVRTCDQRGCEGFEDARAFTWRGTLFLIANSENPKLCRRGMTLMQFDLARLTTVLRGDDRLPGVNARSVSHLIPPGGFRGSSNDQKYWEKNWMPFIHNEKLHLVRFIDPLQVVTCPVSSVTGVHQVNCTLVSETSREGLAEDHIHVPKGSLRASTAVIDRGNDLMALGHVKTEDRRSMYSFFLFTFTKSPPFRITGASSRFVVADEKVQYISGMALVEDWYVLGYSIRDRTTEFLWIRRNEIDRLVTEFQREI